jgi:hypothetical protein
LGHATAYNPAIVTFISEAETNIPLPKQTTLRLFEDDGICSYFDSLADDTTDANGTTDVGDATDDNIATDE